MVFPTIKCLILSLLVSISALGLAFADSASLLADEAVKGKGLSGATIPEPTVFGLIGVVGFLLMLRRRR